MSTNSSISRIPPDHLFMDGTVTADQFVEFGNGFVHELLLKRCRLAPHERVLDMGCGVGQKARVLAEYLSDEGSYEGIDVFAPAIEFCRSAYDEKKNFHFQLADVSSSHYNPDGERSATDYNLPYAGNEFDLVVLACLFTHMLPDEVKNYLSEIRRVLSQDSGRCLVTCFLLTDETREATRRNDPAVSYRFDHDAGVCRLLDLQDPAKGVAYDETWMRGAFAEAGLRICEITYGTWAGGKDMLRALQDCILAVPA